MRFIGCCHTWWRDGSVSVCSNEPPRKCRRILLCYAVWQSYRGLDERFHSEFQDLAYLVAMLRPLVAYICRWPCWLDNDCFFFLHTSLLTVLTLVSFPFQIFFSSLFYNFHFPVMSKYANDTRVIPVASTPRFQDTLYVADTCAAGHNQVVDIENDRKIPSWCFVEYKTRNANTLDARCFCASFSIVQSRL